MAELAVVVVLEDHRPRRGRPAEQRHPAAERERDAQRVLVRGREDHQPRPGSPPDAGVDVQPLVVHRHRDRSGRGTEHRALRTEVAGVLQPDPLAGVDHEAQHLLEGLLGPGGDEHLLGRAPRASRRDHMLGDRTAQPRVPSRLAALEKPRARP